MPLPGRAGEVPDRAEGAGHGLREMAVMDAVEDRAAGAACVCAAVVAATAADRLFDDSVVIVLIGVAVGVAIYIMRAVKKLFSGMVN